MQLKPATRVGVRPLVSLYGESGCGKTYSALLMARGFVGSSGRIAMVDSEEGRGSLYADVIPGGYETLLLQEPFTPDHYIEAITTVEKSGCQIGVLDSGSHEWELGILPMALDNEARSGKAGLHNWRKPKMEHAQFVLKLLRSSIPWIICLRAKYKSKQVRNEKTGKSEIVKDDFVTAIQADDFLFEMTAHACVLPNHHIQLTKCSHPALRDCFPKNGPIEPKHGEMLAQWCANAGGNKPAQSYANLTALKKELWTITTPQHRGDKTVLNQFLVDEMLMPDDKSVETLTAQEIETAIAKYKEKFK